MYLLGGIVLAFIGLITICWLVYETITSTDPITIVDVFIVVVSISLLIGWIIGAIHLLRI